MQNFMMRNKNYRDKGTINAIHETMKEDREVFYLLTSIQFSCILKIYHKEVGWLVGKQSW